ncbi:hypothetical protein DSO57_1033266 [Entomophthora muscae]|uniref:Uncharacterized protein n=1 Tax=Entomophthora muscae TaxID=34485 RepID=A0ACC2SPJ0_9FUNG|nr:hypothetical protein DSO57_1033266 [Entomophthora muscae]
MKTAFFWALSIGPIKAIYDKGLVAEPRILGGEESAMDVQDNKISLEFPFMASLQYNGKHSCGGTAVNNKFIITAGHCAKNTANWTARVYLRSLDAKDQELEGRNPGSPPVQTHKVLRINLHPGFKRKPIENDIAIWEVERIERV